MFLLFWYNDDREDHGDEIEQAIQQIKDELPDFYAARLLGCGFIRRGGHISVVGVLLDIVSHRARAADGERGSSNVITPRQFVAAGTRRISRLCLNSKQR